MENKQLEEMNSDELSNLLVEKDKQIISQIELLNTVQTEKHNMEVKLMNLSESIRMCKLLVSRMRLEKEIIERLYWKSRGK